MTWVVPRRSLSVCAPGCVVCCIFSFFVSRSSSSCHNHHTTTPPCSHLCYHPTSLRAVCIFCHPLLTAPFTSNLDAPSGCLGGMCSFPPPLPTCGCPRSSSFKLFPSSLILSSQHPSQCAAWLPQLECSWLFLSPVACIFLKVSFFFLSISIWSMQSPFSPYQTLSDS
jgi:hypothetical protein